MAISTIENQSEEQKQFMNDFMRGPGTDNESLIMGKSSLMDGLDNKTSFDSQSSGSTEVSLKPYESTMKETSSIFSLFFGKLT